MPDWKLTDDWRRDVITRARKLFPNQGLHPQAEFIAKLHPLAIDYLTQAPVLACALGAAQSTRSDHLYVAMRVGGPIERGERLRNVMAAVQLPTPLRRLQGFALSPNCRPTIYRLAQMDPSPLALAIPGKPGAQRTWLSRLGTWHEVQNRRVQVASLPFAWAAREISRHLPEASEVAAVVDFLVSNPGNERWSWDKAMSETQLWHDRLATEKQMLVLGGGIQASTVVDFSDLPEEWRQEGLQFVKLSTPAAVIEEGRMMRHCVASYLRDIIDGRCSIYSIRNQERRLATLEFSKVTGIRQLAGFANGKPAAFVYKAAQRFQAAAREAAHA